MSVKSLGNITVTYNSTNITSYLNTQSLQATVAAIDTTNLASTGAEQIAGLVSWSIPLSGQWAKALHDVLNPDCVSPPTTLRTLVIVVGASGAQATYTWTSNSFISDYSFSVEPTGAITWSGTLSVSGQPTMS